jgi:urease accessory protein UreF
MDALRTETRAMSRTIGEKLHRYLESLVKDLLPERWVELIKRLNSEEARCLSPKRADSERKRNRPATSSRG